MNTLEKCENVMTKMRLTCVALVPVSTELANGFLQPSVLVDSLTGYFNFGRGDGGGVGDGILHLRWSGKVCEDTDV